MWDVPVWRQFEELRLLDGQRVSDHIAGDGEQAFPLRADVHVWPVSGSRGSGRKRSAG
jgi:hypothetical protein